MSTSKELVRGFTLAQISAMPILEMYGWFAGLSADERARLNQLSQDAARKNSIFAAVDVGSGIDEKLVILQIRSLVSDLFAENYAAPYAGIASGLVDLIEALRLHGLEPRPLSADTAQIIVDELEILTLRLLGMQQRLACLKVESAIH